MYADNPFVGLREAFKNGWHVPACVLNANKLKADEDVSKLLDKFDTLTLQDMARCILGLVFLCLLSGGAFFLWLCQQIGMGGLLSALAVFWGGLLFLSERFRERNLKASSGLEDLIKAVYNGWYELSEFTGIGMERLAAQDSKTIIRAATNKLVEQRVGIRAEAENIKAMFLEESSCPSLNLDSVLGAGHLRGHIDHVVNRLSQLGINVDPNELYTKVFAEANAVKYEFLQRLANEMGYHLEPIKKSPKS